MTRAAGQLLLRAARTGDVARVEKALADGAYVDTAEYDGMTPLMTAACHGHAAVVDVLLAANATVRMSCYQRHTPLYYAMQRGHVEIVKKLVATGADADRASPYDETAIMCAAAGGHVDLFEFFVRDETTQSVHDPNHLGETALHHASRQGQLHMVERLLALNVAVDHADRRGWTALLHASKCGHISIVETLLSAGQADIHLTNALGESALFLAARHGHVAVVQIVLAWGARVDVVTRAGQSLMHATTNIHMIATLVAAGIDIDAIDRYGLSALLEAAELGHADLIDWLFDSPLVDVNRRSSNGLSALMLALQREHHGVVEKLGACNVTDRSGS